MSWLNFESMLAHLLRANNSMRYWLIDWLIKLTFNIPLQTKQAILETFFPASFLASSDMWI